MQPLLNWAIGLGMAAATATPAAAQAPSTTGPVEVSFGVGRMFPTFGDFSTEDMTEAGVDLRLTVPFSPRFAIEGFGTVGRRGSQFVQRTEGLYGAQIRQRLLPRSRSSTQPFLTYGAAGYYAHVTQHPAVIPQPGGGRVQLPGWSYTEFDEPFAALVGAGVTQRIGRHVAIRAETHLMMFLYLPLGYRFTTSVMIPFGALR